MVYSLISHIITYHSHYTYNGCKQFLYMSQSAHSRKKYNLQNSINHSVLTQRQQLRSLVLNRFLRDYSRNNTQKAQAIKQEVQAFFQTQAITEESLKLLKAKIANMVGKTGKIRSISVQQPVAQINITESLPPIHQQGLPSIKQVNPDQTQKIPPNRNTLQSRSSKKSKASKTSKTSSISVSSSSYAPRSVYIAEGDADDEWATLVRFDTELFKKERQLQKLKEIETKRRLKAELDVQLKQKQKKKQQEQQLQKDFVSVQVKQCDLYDKRQKNKAEDIMHKIQHEKAMRSIQIKEERKRRKNQQHLNAQLQKKLVNQVKAELQIQKQELQKKKELQKQRFKQLIAENQGNQKKIQEEQAKERLADIRLQQQYEKLLKQQEEKRLAQKKQREERTKKILGTYTDNVMRNQKEQQQSQDQKMLNYLKEAQQREEISEQLKRSKLLETQEEMRKVLAKQMDQKKVREKKEEATNSQQAQIWKKDNFKKHQQKKHSYLKEVHSKHQEVLLSQIKDKNSKGKNKKMNSLELLYNKALMKEAAKLQNIGLKKQVLQEH